MSTICATASRLARLRHAASVEDINWRAPRGLDRTVLQSLLSGRWIGAHENLLITGPTGVGKSWIACALGHKACRDDIPVLYQRLPRLVQDLDLARGDGRCRATNKMTGVWRPSLQNSGVIF